MELGHLLTRSGLTKCLKGRQIINLLGASTCLGLTLVATRNLGTRRI